MTTEDTTTDLLDEFIETSDQPDLEDSEMDDEREQEDDDDDDDEPEEKPAQEAPKQAEVKSKYEGLTDEQKAEAIAKLQEAEELTEEDRGFLKAEGYEIEEADKEQVPEGEAKKEEEKKEVVKPSYAKELEAIYPDRTFETNADYEQAAADFIAEERAANQDLVNMLNDNPDLLQVFKEMKSKKVPFAVAIASVIGEDSIIPKPGDEGYEEFVKAKIMKDQEAERAAQRAQKIQKNYDDSVKTAANFVKTKELPEPKAKEFYSKVDQVISAITEGVYSPEFLEMVYKAMNYDSDVTLAKKQGEIAGANRKIFKLRQAKKGDNMPKFTKSKDSVKQKDKSSDSFLDLVADIVEERNR